MCCLLRLSGFLQLAFSRRRRMLRQLLCGAQGRSDALQSLRASVSRLPSEAEIEVAENVPSCCCQEHLSRVLASTSLSARS
jgi:hypothetical protein